MGRGKLRPFTFGMADSKLAIGSTADRRCQEGEYQKKAYIIGGLDGGAVVNSGYFVDRI